MKGGTVLDGLGGRGIKGRKRSSVDIGQVNPCPPRGSPLTSKIITSNCSGLSTVFKIFKLF